MATVVQDELMPSATAEGRPAILVFDSGVGGLSVYDEIRQLLPDAHYIYVFDNVGFPYGEKTEHYIVERVKAITAAITRDYTVSIAVVACNTASTVSLPALREAFDFPVVGVVPAIKPAARLTRNGIVGLLATRGTVKRPYTHQLVRQFAKECHIEMLGSAELVVLAEQKLQGDAVSLSDVRKIIRPWLKLPEPPDTVVLGCTHFPLLKEELQSVLPEGTRLVDSGAAIARRTAWLLQQQPVKTCSSVADIAFCTAMTVETERLLPVLQRYGLLSLKILAI
ncbi:MULTISPECIES: glutamate racemase [unclassified Tatumella]|uniref:glutamate racemase n=1 Tax=unclassified Tatumella TaxID=2649542 RepID=UPI001BAF2CA4|nr:MULTISPECIES: glutamate racemase [unclassified Tatumella]MBS0856554.1 glutamate racemase [Tatumella sp. JGM16]MBS0877961.1 glutamate racemase [Tatumella sp. JGM82]MBS0891667.1 glutamate racemase [Tatumella sp. JGM94]MBS0902509.1 glutamate racemase [Tatumella sp. JGM100]MBS0913522.1 glutamate racemase [Tatumella sp. JGM91]